MSIRTCIYVAARAAEARRVETVLTRHGIDYIVEIALSASRLRGLLPMRYRGARFYVVPEQARVGRAALHAAGLTKGLVANG